MTFLITVKLPDNDGTYTMNETTKLEGLIQTRGLKIEDYDGAILYFVGVQGKEFQAFNLTDTFQQVKNAAIDKDGNALQLNQFYLEYQKKNH